MRGLKRKNSELNGIDVAGLQDTIAQLAETPADARYRFGVTTAWKGRARTETRVDTLTIGDRTVERDFSFATDEPSTLCGANDAANPQEYLLGALNACMVFGYVTGAALRGITLTKLEIESHADLDLRGFLGIDADVKPGYDTIHATVRLEGDGTPEQYREIHETVQQTSPNHFSLRHPIRVESDLRIEGKEKAR
ncbi:MAG: OsmC family protein [Planctomycetota bacterium]|jgi:uncharacterized OsmC-like protein